MGVKTFWVVVSMSLIWGVSLAQTAGRDALASPRAGSKIEPQLAWAQTGKKGVGKKIFAKPTSRSATKKARIKKRIARSGHQRVLPAQAKADKTRHVPKMARAPGPTAHSGMHRRPLASPSIAPKASTTAQRRADGADFASPSPIVAAGTPKIVAPSAAMADAQSKRQVHKMIRREEENIRRELADQGRLASQTL